MADLKDTLTIAIPVYNDVKFIENTIVSCLDQGATILLCDNSSTDGTSDICRKYAEQHDFVHWHRHESNIGAFNNFKFGLDRCTTRYFTWLGSHDKLTPGYAQILTTALDADAGAGLAVGTIKYIDEDDKMLRKVTTSQWANDSKEGTPLDRVEACINGLRRDIFHFYSVFRADVLRSIWVDQPSMGFDRALVVRAAAAAKIIYCEEAVLLGREFPKTRDSKQDMERRSKVVVAEGAKPLAKDTLARNMSLVNTALSLVKKQEDLSQALRIVDRVNRRFQSRRHFQRIRLLKIAGALVLLCAFAVAVYL